MVPFIDHEKLKWKQPLLLGCRTEEEAINEIEGRKSRKWHMNVGKHTLNGNSSNKELGDLELYLYLWWLIMEIKTLERRPEEKNCSSLICL